MKKIFIIISQFFFGALVPLFFCLVASICAFYHHIFVNISIPFVIVIPLWIGIKIKRKSKPFFIGILVGLLLVLAYIFFGFVKISRVDTGLYF